MRHCLYRLLPPLTILELQSLSWCPSPLLPSLLLTNPLWISREYLKSKVWPASSTLNTYPVRQDQILISLSSPAETKHSFEPFSASNLTASTSRHFTAPQCMPEQILNSQKWFKSYSTTEPPPMPIASRFLCGFRLTSPSPLTSSILIFNAKMTRISPFTEHQNLCLMARESRLFQSQTQSLFESVAYTIYSIFTARLPHILIQLYFVMLLIFSSLSSFSVAIKPFRGSQSFSIFVRCKVATNFSLLCFITIRSQMKSLSQWVMDLTAFYSEMSHSLILPSSPPLMSQLRSSRSDSSFNLIDFTTLAAFLWAFENCS